MDKIKTLDTKPSDFQKNSDIYRFFIECSISFILIFFNVFGTKILYFGKKIFFFII